MNISKEQRDFWVVVWRGLVLAAVVGIAAVMWTTINDSRDSRNAISTAQSDIRDLKSQMTGVQASVTAMQQVLVQTQTTLDAGIRQMMVEQNRRIQSLEDRTVRQADEIARLRELYAGIRANQNIPRPP